AKAAGGADGRPDRNAVPGREPRHAAEMIAVLVGHEDRIEVRRRLAEPREAGFRLLQPQAAVEHHAATVGLHQRRVAATAAPKPGEAHGQALSGPAGERDIEWG